MQNSKEYPLSLEQLDLWNYDRINKQSLAYHVPMAYKVEGIFERSLLKQALERTIQYYPVFKTRFYENEKEEVNQICDESITIPVQVKDVNEDEEAFINGTLKAMVKEPFDLKKGGLARIYLFYMSNGSTILYMNMHHIIFDGISISILLHHIQTEYKIAAGHEKITLTSSQNGYRDFVDWQQKVLVEDKSAYTYWSTQIKEEAVKLSLQQKETDGDLPYRGGCCEFEIEKMGIEKYTKKYTISDFCFFLSLYQLTLMKNDSHTPVVTLFPFMNRMKSEFVDQIGFFVNMLRLPCDAKNESFLDFVTRTQERIYEVLQYGYYPLQKIRKEKKIQSLGNSIFYYQNWVSSMAKNNESDEQLCLKYIPDIYQEGEFVFVFEILELEDSYTLKIRYDKNVFDDERIRQFLMEYQAIMEQVLKQEEIQIEQILLSVKQDDNVMLYDKQSRVYDYVDKQAERNPDKIAIQCGNDRITYKELKERSEQFYLCLKEKGIQSKDVIGVCMNRSIDLIVSLLAVMKADAIYVPIDVIYPQDRISYMIENSNMKLILSDASSKNMLDKVSGSISMLCVEEMRMSLQPENFVAKARENEIVYLLYTSGSTGKPKGVQIYHRGLVNALLSFARQKPGFQQNDVMFSVTTVCFDIAELEMFMPLMQGGTVSFPPQTVLNDMNLLKKELEESNATVMQATPATLKSLLSIGWVDKALKILCGGEALPEDLAKSLLLRKTELWNMYGPTETTIWSTVSKVTDAADITIGKPIANTQVYILDEERKPVGPLEEGELFISGDSVAKGYLGREDLTKERFLDNPFSDAPYKMYATGDIAKFREDGEIVYCGRKDTQVKIRGYRIELKEIEIRLKMLDEIEDAIVVVREDIPGKQFITAFVISQQSTIDMSHINECLKEWLPRYMIPVKYVVVDLFPKTLNQKYDRKILREASIESILSNYKNKDTKENITPETGKTLTDAVKEEVIAYMHSQSESLGEVDVRANIGEYGFDSVTFVKFSDFLNERYQIDSNPTMFYSYVSVEAIAKHLVEQYSSDIASAYQRASIRQTVSREMHRGVLESEYLSSVEDGIAIVGFSAKFPQSDSAQEFWEGLVEGKNMISEVPEDRWDWRESYGEPTKENNKTNSKWGGFINNVKLFDAAFFGISPREAKRMDPQQRFMLQCVWSTIEDSGHKMSELRGSDMGVFIGTTGSDYMGMMNQNDIDGYTLTGIAKSIIANRLSFIFDWHGPSEPVDTACSSSLVALHRAVSAIRNGECSQAIAGGVNLILNAFANIASTKVGMLSPDGACKTFDESANGYVRGEGVGCVYLKKLADAKRGHDTIYAVVRNTRVNHGGKANSLTAPNPQAQADLIRRTYLGTGVDIRNISYIETHGTGTSLGDPIEINGLKEAFQLMDKDNDCQSEEHIPCLLGSVKTNIGHLEAAAGIASVIKVLLALKHSYIPGNIHLKNTNPYIDLEGTPFVLVKEGCVWNPHRKDGTKVPKMAGISSFGFGGVNAHVILEEYIDNEKTEHQANVTYQVPLSAKTEEALLEYEQNLLAFLQNSPELALCDIAFTLQEGREWFEIYNLFEVSDIAELVKALEETLETKEFKVAKKNEALEIKKFKGHRISLPTYPFAKDEYWYDEIKEEISSDAEHDNTTKTWLIDPNSKFVTDHIVGNAPIVPGALQIETIRNHASKPVKCLRDILFYQTITPECIPTLTIQEVTQGQAVTYAIQSEINNEVYSQATEARLEQDTEWLRQWSQDEFTSAYTGSQCYELYTENGFFYQESFQVIQKLWCDTHRAMAYLKLPACYENSFSDETLHPSLIDGALQTILVLLDMNTAGEKNRAAFFPFSIGKLEMIAPLEKECLVHAEELPQKNQSIRRYNILITSLDGRELIQLKNYMIKKTEEKEILYFTETETEKSAGFSVEETGIDSDTIYSLDGNSPCFQTLAMAKDEIANAIQNGYRYFLYQYTKEIDDRDNLLCVFCYMKVLADCAKNKTAYFAILYAGAESKEISLRSAYVPMLRTLAIETPAIHVAFIEVDASFDQMKCANYEFSKGLLDSSVAYRDGQRFCCELIEVSKQEVMKESVFQKGDTVLIAGAGKLAVKLAKYLSKKYQIHVILCGRRDSSQYEFGKNEHISYIQCNLKNYQETKKLIEQIEENYHQLDGIIDCAGIKNDAFLFKKTVEEFIDVVDSKQEVVVNLDKASKDCKLRYFICYSSVSGLFGNIGQIDYAFGNGYLNYFCIERNRMAEQGERYGKAIAIDWCYWEDGGMHAGQQAIDNMESNWGVKPVKDLDGIHMLEECVRMPYSIVLPVTGYSEKIRKTLLTSVNDTIKKHTEVLAEEKEHESMKEERISLKKSMQDGVKKYLRKLIAEVTGLSESKITDTQSFQEYGIDSVIIMDLNKELGESFINLPKTLFFEYETIEELADFFVTNYEDTVQKMFQIKYIKPADATVVNSVQRDEVAEWKPMPAAKPVVRESNVSEEYTEQFQPGSRDVAIIGMNGLYPMADNADEFWKNLCEGIDCITEVPPERWDYHVYFDSDKSKQGKSYIKWGSFLKDIDKFDPLFFGISPVEAQMLDPQERLFLECVWHTIEDSGYTRERLKNQTVGVFVGVMWGQYQLYGANPLEDGTVLVPASSYASIANRVSYFFNFRGPSIAMDTMCSSSLTSIHLACNSIISGESDLAVAGGVNLTLHPNKHVFLSQTKFAASDGRCHSFGEGGDGYVPGEAVGSILMKPLDKAIRDHDNIYAVIKGSSINHGGKSNGYTVPNVKQQADVISKVYEKAHINPRTVNYIEAHGTGTALGDPIEISSMTNVFGKASDDKQYCSIGSVKSNVGHCESAAGIIGIIKILLQMKYKMLVPSIHSKVLNPNINFLNTPFYVQQNLQKWEKVRLQENGVWKEYPRRAAINSFGAGGSNAHILLEEYVQPVTQVGSQEELIVLSGKDKDRLEGNVRGLVTYLKKHTGHVSKYISDSHIESVETVIVTEISKLSDIQIDNIDQKVPINEYLMTTVELQTFMENVNTSLVISPKLSMNDLVEYVTIRELIQGINARLKWGNDSYDTEAGFPELTLQNISYTLQTGREAMKERLAFSVKSVPELIEKLESYLAKDNKDYIYEGTVTNGCSMPIELLSDEDEFVRMLVEKNKLEKIAMLWVSGIEVPWNALHNDMVRPVSLPGYDFRKDSCWLPDVLIKPRKFNPLQQSDKQQKLFLPRWEEIKLVVSNSERNDREAVLYDSSQIEPSLIDWIDKEQESRMFLDLDKIGRVELQKIEEVDCIYYLAFNRNGFTGLESSEEIEQIGKFTVGKLWNTVHKLNQVNAFEKDRKFVVLSNDFTSEDPKQQSNAFAAGMNGFLKSFAREYFNITTVFVGLDMDELKSEDFWIRIHSLPEEKGRLTTVLLHKNRLKKQTFIPYNGPDNDYSIFKNSGTYVLIGGSGNVGQKLSIYLAKKYNANIIVVGRRTIDEKINILSSMVVKEGGTFSYKQNDISNYTNTSKVLHSIREESGEINGIFDLAMALQYSSIQNMTEEIFYHDIEAKVTGSIVLTKVIHELKLNLDFLCVFSSGESFTGSSGWSTYALGCAFEDSYVKYVRENMQINAVTINWGFWDKAGDPYIERLKKNGIHPLTEETGMPLLETALASNEQQILALDVEKDILVKMGIVKPEKVTSKVDKEQKTTTELSSHSQLTMETVKDYSKTIFERVLSIGKDRFEDDVDFTEYGVDSIIITELHQAFETDLGKLIVTMIAEHPTFNSLAKYLLENHQDKLAMLFGIANMELKTPETVSEEVYEVEGEKNIRLIEEISRKDINSYLTDYSKFYKNDSLMSKAKQALKIEHYKATTDTMAHLLVKTQFGNELEVFTLGQGEPLLLIPAIGLTAPTWINQIHTFSDRYRIIVIHNPGYGISTLSEDISGETVIASFKNILEQLGIHKINIVGSCFGGIAAQQFSAAYPEMTKTLTLCGAFYKNFGLPDISLESIPIDKMGEATQMVAGGINKDFDGIIEKEPTEKEQYEKARKLLMDSQCVNPLVVMRYISQILTVHTTEILSSIQAPTLCISGTLDTIVDKESSHYIAKNVQSGGVIEIDGAGHYPYLTHPSQFNNLLQDFLNSNN